MNRGACRSLVFASIALPLSLLSLAACGDNLRPAEPDAAPVVEAPPDAMPFPIAPHPSAPQIVSLPGTVLATPKVVPIFFAADDTVRADTEAFLTQLAASPYWSTVSKEYGVGALTIEPTVISTDPAPTADADIQTYLTTMTDGTHAGWPKADDNTIFTVFLPLGDSTLSDFPGECTSWGGYHADTGGTSPIVYAVIPRCAIQGDYVYPLTLATSHELDEAATDPRPYTAPAFSKMDPDHYIWGQTPGAEVGDLCEYVHAASQRLVGIYAVQRQWSNEAAAAGHDPCVPELKTGYLGVAPVLDDAVNLTSRGGMIATKGVQIPAGMSKTIEVDLFSDMPTDAFTVTAYDVQAQFRGRTAELTFSWDKTTGKNGDKLQLTITHVKAGRSGGSEFVIFAGPTTDTQSQWWGEVAN